MNVWEVEMILEKMPESEKTIFHQQDEDILLSLLSPKCEIVASDEYVTLAAIR